MNVVLLNYNKNVVIVPEKWIEHPHQFTEQTKIFYSPESEDPPDFTLPIKAFFDRTARKCYYGFVLKQFGKSVAHGFYSYRLSVIFLQ